MKQKSSYTNYRIIFLLALLLLATTTISSSSAASTIYVNNATGNDSYDGTSATVINPTVGPKATIQNGTNTVDPNGFVYVADGTYKEHIIISKNMSLIGQNMTGTIIDGTNNGRPLTITSGITVNLTNISIINGKVTDWAAEGGGIHNSGKLNMTNCNVENNTANGYSFDHVHAWGGGICNVGTLTMTNCNVKNNTATATCSESYAEDANAEGGGVYNSGKLNMTNCNVEANIVFSNWRQYVAIGGGISNVGTAHIIGCTIINNIANSTGLYVTITGGGISNHNGGSLTANFNRIFNNTPNAIENWWGGVINSIEDNWWGSNNPVFGSLLAGVTPTNWLYMTINATPSNINNRETSLITANFNNHYNGTTLTPYIPGIGEYIPDGTPVSFATTLGSIPGTILHTVGGIVTATFTASQTPGTAYVSGLIDDYQTPYPANLTTPFTTVTINPLANLNITKTANVTTANVGDIIRYTISITNNGPDNVTFIELEDILPLENGQVPEYISPLPDSLAYIPEGAKFTWTNILDWFGGILQPGNAVSVLIDVRIPSSAAATIFTNKANITSVVYPYFNETTANVYVNQALVELNKTVNNTQPNIGETVQFTIVARNSGPSTANNLVVSDTLPIGLDFINCTNGGVWDPVTRTVTWPAAVVLNSANVTYYLTALVNSTSLAGTTVTNVVNETHSEYPNNSTTNCTIYVPKADLYIQITSNKNNPKVGETFTLTYKLGNNGPDNAQNVTITIPLPEGFVISEIKGDGNWTRNGNTITWTFNNVTVGDPYLYITGRTTKPGIYLFNASIASDTFNINSSGVNSLNLNSVPQANAATTTNTIVMQKTGTPLAGIVFAILMVLGGFISTLKKTINGSLSLFTPFFLFLIK
ncbi:MAG: hypothetical protein Q7U35_10125 [Methanobacteriaceae archaeon]|nr:hypothetical protein [Methanobacteriaceae archaeon]MDP2835432.1 hypothetical protein [Methanobacteriaceae archaeon]